MLHAVAGGHHGDGQGPPQWQPVAVGVAVGVAVAAVLGWSSLWWHVAAAAVAVAAVLGCLWLCERLHQAVAVGVAVGVGGAGAWWCRRQNRQKPWAPPRVCTISVHTVCDVTYLGIHAHCILGMPPL